MANNVNMLSRTQRNQQFLEEVALNAYGYGSKKTRGGTGFMGVIQSENGNDRVIKFSTNRRAANRRIGGIPEGAREAALTASNELRMSLGRIASSRLSGAELQRVQQKLGLNQYNEIEGDGGLLDRKVTASVVKLIDKDIWDKVNAGSAENRNRYKTGNLNSDQKTFEAMQVANPNNVTPLSCAVKRQRIHGVITAKMSMLQDNIAQPDGLRARSRVGGQLVDVTQKIAKVLENDLRAAAELLRTDEEMDAFLLWLNRPDAIRGTYKMVAFLNGCERESATQFDNLLNARYLGARQTYSNDPRALAKAKALHIKNLGVHNGVGVLVANEQGPRFPSQQNLRRLLTQADEQAVQSIENRIRTMLGLRQEVAGRFANSFSNSQELGDANRILELLGNNQRLNWDDEERALLRPLIHAAVKKARQIQPNGGPLTAETVWRALTGKWGVPRNPIRRAQLLEGARTRIQSDLRATRVGAGEQRTRSVRTGVQNGLTYEAILKKVRNPQYRPKAPDYYDVPVFNNN